jgi:hypothetical protein
MNDKQRHALVTSIHDMLALERDILHAVGGQLADERIDRHPGLRNILQDIVAGSQFRADTWERLSKEHGGGLGATVKGGLMAVAGAVAGIYDKLREHPVSRMVRDDIIALDVAVTGYGMLLTLGRCLDHKEAVALSQLAMVACAPLVVRLDFELPLIIAMELAEDGPEPDTAAVELAQDAIRQVWQHLPPP